MDNTSTTGTADRTGGTAVTGSPARHDPAAPGLLAGKAVLITGAGRGIGAAAARLFAREGARVMLAARTEAQLKGVAEEVRAAGGTAEHVVCDMAEPDSVRAAVDRTVDRFGRLDAAFNNAGTGAPPGPLDLARKADFDHVYAVNLKGVWVAMAAEVAAIRATAGTGAIVNNTSVGGLRANPELPAYGAMKAGVNSLTLTAAVTYGPEAIRVNAVAPAPRSPSCCRTGTRDRPVSWRGSTP